MWGRRMTARRWGSDVLPTVSERAGDYLQRRGNELAIAMSFCHEGRPLDLNETGLRAAHATLTGKICILVHGFCCNEGVWTFPATATAAQPDTYGTRLQRNLDYTPAYTFWNHLSSIGYAITFVGLLVFLSVLVEAAVRRRPARANPWGEGATTLEWTLPSPPPFHQFNELPVIHADSH